MSAAPVEPTEERKTAHLSRVWAWLLTLQPQPCGNCASELAILAVERDISGSATYQGSDKMCRRRDRADRSCMERTRPLWKNRPKEEKTP